MWLKLASRECCNFKMFYITTVETTDKTAKEYTQKEMRSRSKNINHETQEGGKNGEGEQRLEDIENNEQHRNRKSFPTSNYCKGIKCPDQRT